MISKDKVAVVTGGNSGLGRAVAEKFLSTGMRVAVLDLNAVDIESFAADAKHFMSFAVDVTKEKEISTALESIVETWGHIHVCVNCAGIAPAKKIVDRENNAMPLSDFKKVIDINLLGTFATSAQVAEKMSANAPEGEANERGVIINTASVAAFEGQKGQCAYAASKGAIASLTLPMARDLAVLGIRVVAVAPGVMGTPLMLGMPDSVQESLVSNIPFPKRLGKPEEFASLVLHAVENAYLNGEVIRLDGALRMQ